MGVAKAALESTSRYLARDLGRSRSGSTWSRPARSGRWPQAHPRASTSFEEIWDDRAPLGWDIADPEPAARGCAALLSDWFPTTTGEIVHVDGGVHAIGG